MRDMNLEGVAALIVSAIACATDVRSRRIPNWLTLGSAAAAMVFELIRHGVGAAEWSVLGWIVGIVVFLPLFMAAGMGGGDVKLVGALGAWLGVAPVLRVAMYSAIAGGVMALGVAMAHGYLRAAFTNVRTIVTSWLFGIGRVPGLTLADAHGPRLAYALPIAVGTIVTLWLH